MIVTDDEDLATLCRSLRNQGRDEMGAWLHHERLGFNYRMDELSASLGVSQIRRLDRVPRQARLGGRPDTGGCSPPSTGSGSRRVLPHVEMSWFVYVVTLAEGIDRDAVMAQMGAQGVPARAYFSPIHLQPYIRDRLGDSTRHASRHRGDRRTHAGLALPQQPVGGARRACGARARDGGRGCWVIEPRASGSVLVEGVSRSFRGHEVLREVDLRLGPGVIAAILGENGSGKTTLLRLLAGTVLPDAGTIAVCGGPPGKGASAFVPSGDRALYWRLTGRADLAFFARLSGFDPVEVARVTESAAAALGAEELLDKPIGECSTGQRRRLVFAQGLVGRAPVLLADEPFDDLDEPGRVAVSELMHSWAGAGGVVVFAAPARGDGPRADLIFELDAARLARA